MFWTLKGGKRVILDVVSTIKIPFSSLITQNAVKKCVFGGENSNRQHMVRKRPFQHSRRYFSGAQKCRIKYIFGTLIMILYLYLYLNNVQCTIMFFVGIIFFYGFYKNPSKRIRQKISRGS